MNLSTKLRLISMGNDLKAAVANVILENTDEKNNAGITQFMKDISNNGCAYSNLKGLQYHGEMQDFFKKYAMDIEMVIFLYNTGKDVEIKDFKDNDSEKSWFAVEEMINELIIELKIK